MSNANEIRSLDPTNLTLHTQASFYTPDDLAAAERDWDRGEVEAAFRRYRAAVDVGDHDTMTALLAEGGRGGNATYGFFTDRASYRQFLADCWLEVIPNHSVWVMIDRGRILNKWCEVLPGDPPGGGRYDYFGFNELIYAGGGQFRLLYSVPDLFGLNVLYARWKADGQHETHGDLYAGLA